MLIITEDLNDIVNNMDVKFRGEINIMGEGDIFN